MPKRELSCFLCKELLYEYLVDSVDEKRREAINIHLEKCPSCKSEFESLLSAKQYISQLSKIEVLPEYVKKVSVLETFSSRFKQNAAWKNWPDPLKWTVESLAAGTVIALLFTVVTKKIFVHKIGEKGSILVAEVQQAPKVGDEAKQANAQKDGEVVDDEASEIMAGGAGEDAIETAVSPTEEPKAAPLPIEKKSVVSAKPTPAVQASSPIKKVVQGFVYRANMVMGSRYPDGKIEGWPMQRKVFSFTANILARALIDWKVSDYTNGFRFYNRKAAEFIGSLPQKHKGYIYLSETISNLLNAGFKISSFPILFVNRKRGESNTNIREIVSAFTGIFSIAWHHRKG